MTLILIRMIEAFKLIDMPSVMTGGGPGTATESMTLQLHKVWKASNFNFGPSAALAYILLIVVTFAAVMYVNVIRQNLMKRL
jgi:multiple sugar transport system permease protein